MLDGHSSNPKGGIYRRRNAKAGLIRSGRSAMQWRCTPTEAVSLYFEDEPETAFSGNDG